MTPTAIETPVTHEACPVDDRAEAVHRALTLADLPTDAVVCDVSINRPSDYPTPGVRHDLVARVRARIAQGGYGEAELDKALDNMLDDLGF